jgi:hypothetical protein
MSTIGMSSPAAWVLRSLMDHPHLRTVDAIVAGPVAPETADAQQVADGLAELKDRGLAVEEPGEGWRVTDAARAAGQPS